VHVAVERGVPVRGLETVQPVEFQLEIMSTLLGSLLDRGFLQMSMNSEFWRCGRRLARARGDYTPVEAAETNVACFASTVIWTR
jgi:hypothetical protein